MKNTRSESSSKSKKLIVADDDPSILEALTMMLEDEGYDVETAMDNQVVKMVEKHTPDLLLLDIWMSGADGRDICRKLKSNAKTRNVPVIMVSANKDTRKFAREAGADGFLAKPFEMDELLEIVRKHVD